MPITVIKRDGRRVAYDEKKITNAVYSAGIDGIPAQELDEDRTDEIKDFATNIMAEVAAYLVVNDIQEITVEQLQDIVVSKLQGKTTDEGKRIAENYISYRAKRTQIRTINSDINKAISNIINTDSKDSDDKRENANINTDCVMGSMLKIGSTVTKEFNLNNLINEKYSAMHRAGRIHLHDLDFMTTVNCLHLPLSKLLKIGYSTGHGFLRSPATIQSASSLTCIAIQSSQNDFFGGQSIPNLDFALAPYVLKSLARNLLECATLLWGVPYEDLKKQWLVDVDELIQAQIETREEQATHLSDTDIWMPRVKNCLAKRTLAINESLAYAVRGLDARDPKSIVKLFMNMPIIMADRITSFKAMLGGIAVDYSVHKTIRDTKQAMEALVHNLCTMQSRAGSQTPFSSVNFGLDTSWAGRLVSKSLMDAIDAGLGLGETAIFPIAIMKLKKGITDKGSDNYDLFQQSCRVSAKRLFPNWVNVDAPFNLPYYNPDKPRTHIASMGALAEGFVDLKVYDENNKLKATLSRYKIQDVKAYLLDHPELIDGDPNFIDFDEVTKYVNIKPGRLKIADSQLGAPYWVNVKKYMYWNDPKAKWLGISYNFNTSKWLGLSGSVTVTDDHPLRARCTDTGPYERILAKDLKVGDRLCLADAKGVYSEISKIEEIPTTECITGYDFETESDCFNVNDIVSHNCRTRVISNAYDPEHEQVEGRGNLFWTTINLPYLALEAKEKLIEEKGLSLGVGDTLPDELVPALYDKLIASVDSTIDAVLDFSMTRYELVAKRKAKNYPFSMGQHEYVGSDHLRPEDEIREVLKQGTISIGFIGLAETLIALTGKHHGESELAQVYGLTLIKHMRERTDKATKDLGFNFSLMGSPAEGCTGRLCKLIKKRWGIIPGITDKAYLTNSSHVPVSYKTTITNKVTKEAPYHELENAGAICYVELSADATKNLEGFEKIVTYMADAGLGYFAINHPVTRDPICGYVGPLRSDGTCPRCGRKNGEGVSVEKLLSLTSYSPDPEYAVTAAQLDHDDAVSNDVDIPH